MKSEIQPHINLLCCDFTLIVAIITLGKPYFPNMSFHTSIQETLFDFWNMWSYVYGTALTLKMLFENYLKVVKRNKSEKPLSHLQSMDKNGGFLNIYILISYF